MPPGNIGAPPFLLSDDKMSSKLQKMRTDYDKIKNEIQQSLVQASTLTAVDDRTERLRRKQYLDTSIPSTGGG